MKSYDFKLVLAGVSDVTDDQGDALFKSGCDDGTIVSRDGEVFIWFTRESGSLEQAINSAADDVERAGFQVGHVEVHYPVQRPIGTKPSIMLARRRLFQLSIYDLLLMTTAATAMLVSYDALAPRALV